MYRVIGAMRVPIMQSIPAVKLAITSDSFLTVATSGVGSPGSTQREAKADSQHDG